MNALKRIIVTRTFAFAWLGLILAMYAGQYVGKDQAIPVFMWLNFVLAGYMVGFAICGKIMSGTIHMLVHANDELAKALKDIFARHVETEPPHIDGTCDSEDRT